MKRELRFQDIQHYPMGKDGLKWLVDDKNICWMPETGGTTLYKENNLPVRFLFTKGFDCKPLLRPLNLHMEITHNGEIFTPKNELFRLNGYSELKIDTNNNDLDIWVDDIRSQYDREGMTMNDYFKLFEWHFDVFGLIEASLAININTITKGG